MRCTVAAGEILGGRAQGRVVDPATGTDGMFDVLIEDGVIRQVAKDLPVEGAEVYEVPRGAIVAPTATTRSSIWDTGARRRSVAGDEHVVRREAEFDRVADRRRPAGGGVEGVKRHVLAVEGGPDPAPAAELAEQTRVYPLWAEEKDIPPMEFPDASGQRVDMMYPVDSTYWTKLKAFVDYEPVTAIDAELRGVLASTGMADTIARVSSTWTGAGRCPNASRAKSHARSLGGIR